MANYLDSSGLQHLWGKIKALVRQPDWNQNDIGAPDYVRNRPFYEGESVLLDQVVTTVYDPGPEANTCNGTTDMRLMPGQSYSVEFSGTDYLCEAYSLHGGTYIGNRRLYPGETGPDTKEPFILGESGGFFVLFTEKAGSYALSITGTEVVQLPVKFIPNPIIPGTGIKGEVFNGGNASAASGGLSHAEGMETSASGNMSHAEGSQSAASGHMSHAEGDRSAASGQCAHAEGFAATASGDDSHAEGRGTIAAGECQHAQGKYNIEDTAGRYAHIVGNGPLDSERSNAHTLDWDGNAWFAGKISAGTASVPADPVNDNELATKHYVDGKAKIKSFTLPAASWTSNAQTVTVSGVSAGSAVTPSPAPESWEAAGAAGVRCTAQAADSLTFACTTVPTVDLSYNVLIQEVI